ncbi:MAG: PD-(D/E)XK nuclease family transposase [Desulfamplus sp.]|nr:PD-(D/E)XK nuclease family transposase [Desulfamplus sp.]
MLTDHLVIHFLELPKFKNFGLKMDKQLEKWLYYLKLEGIEKEDTLMEILIKEDDTFKRAHEKYVAFTRDDEMVEAYESHMKWVRDYNTKMYLAREEGLKLGLEKGKQEGRKEGEFIGRIQILQQILKKPVSYEDDLLKQNINELELLLQKLQKELNI